MSSVSTEQIERAKQMDLLTYLQRYEPDELVQSGANEYCTNTHGSLKISKGLWIWNKHRIGGRSALDYLVKVRLMGFVEAVEHLSGLCPDFSFSTGSPQAFAAKRPEFILPKRHERSSRVFAYLKWRGINEDIIRHCLVAGLIYETVKVHKDRAFYNCVFVGKNPTGEAVYAMQRGTFTDFCGEVVGSSKDHTFRYSNATDNDVTRLSVSEGAIDALSVATIELETSPELWVSTCYLSLGGNTEKALMQYLDDNPHVRHVVLAVDADDGGRALVKKVLPVLEERGITTELSLPPQGKDNNEYLLISKGLEDRIHRRNKPSKKHENIR